MNKPVPMDTDAFMMGARNALKSLEGMREAFQKRAALQGLSLNGHVQPFNPQAELDELSRLLEAVRAGNPNEKDIKALDQSMSFTVRPTRKGVCWYAGNTPTLDFRLFRTHLSLGRYEDDGRRSTLQITRAPALIQSLISWLEEWRNPFVHPNNYVAYDQFANKLKRFQEKVKQKIQKKGLVEKIREVKNIAGISQTHVIRNMALEVELIQKLNTSLSGLQLNQSKEIIDRLYEFKKVLPQDTPIDLKEKLDTMVAKMGVSKDMIDIANQLTKDAQAQQNKTAGELQKGSPKSNQGFWEDLSFLDGLNNPWTFVNLLAMYPPDHGQLKQIFQILRSSKGDKEWIRYLCVLIHPETAYANAARMQLLDIFADVHQSYKRNPLQVNLSDYYDRLPTAELIQEVQEYCIPAVDQNNPLLKVFTEPGPDQSLLQARARDMLKAALQNMGVDSVKALPQDQIPKLIESVSALIQQELVEKLKTIIQPPAQESKS